MTQKFNELTKHFSQVALDLAELLWSKTVHGKKFDPSITYRDAALHLNVTEADVCDAAHELQQSGFVSHHDASSGCYVEGRLFVFFDEYWTAWTPADDAIKVARALVDEGIPGNGEVIAQVMGWPPRRLNPALSFLVENGYAHGSNFLGGGDFEWTVMATDSTRRFLKSRAS